MENKTHIKRLSNPNYIGSYELMTGGKPVELDVTIEKVVKEHVQNGDKREEAVVCYLKNHKPMILNSTNRKAIEKALGTPYIEDMVGKRITLYVAKIRAFGETVDALRVKPVAPKEPTKEMLSPQHERWAGAVTALKEGKTTIDAIQKSFNVNDENLKLLQDATKK